MGRPVQRPQQISQQIPQQFTHQIHQQVPQQIGGGLITGKYLFKLGQQAQHIHTTGAITGAVQGVGVIPQKPASSSRI